MIFQNDTCARPCAADHPLRRRQERTQRVRLHNRRSRRARALNGLPRSISSISGVGRSAALLGEANLERFQSISTVANTMDAEMRRGNRVPTRRTIGSAERPCRIQRGIWRPPGLSRYRRLCSADNERHSLSIRMRCSFFVASVLAGVGQKDLWAFSKLKSSTHLQPS
jgi:hypothetical protein